jgi:hypothetical protein
MRHILPAFKVQPFSVFMALALLAGVVMESSLYAQYPYPGGGYPGGGYPGGGYPGGGGVGIPMPRLPGSRGGKKPKDQPDSATESEESYAGKLQKLGSKNLLIKLDDGRTLTMNRSDKTKFLKNSKDFDPGKFGPGDLIAVDATEDKQGFYTALRVIMVKAASPEERAQAIAESETGPEAASQQSSRKDGDASSPTVNKESPQDGTTSSAGDQPAAGSAAEKNKGDRGTISGTANPPSQSSGNDSGQAAVASPPQAPASPPQFGDERPPVLKRGPQPPPSQRPAPTQRADSRPSVPTGPPADSSAPTPNAGSSRVLGNYRPGDALVEKARAATFAFAGKLPNFICQEFMARFVRISNASGWQPQDVISAEVIDDGGHESYRNLKINDRPTEKKMEDLSGAWSTGEFSTTLIDLFHPTTDTLFHSGEDTTIAGRRARIYDFEVKQANSHWHVQMASQGLLAAYKGSVWIDMETARVLRIEIQARDLPSGFPMDTVESAVDYSPVRIGNETPLLPVHAESLGCQRGSNACSRNVIDFRNYREYTADSTITY